MTAIAFIVTAFVVVGVIVLAAVELLIDWRVARRAQRRASLKGGRTRA